MTAPKDIVARLRHLGNGKPEEDIAEWVDFASLYLVRAADEITRLRTEAAQSRAAGYAQALVDAAAHLRAQAEAMYERSEAASRQGDPFARPSTQEADDAVMAADFERAAASVEALPAPTLDGEG